MTEREKHAPNPPKRGSTDEYMHATAHPVARKVTDVVSAHNVITGHMYSDTVLLNMKYSGVTLSHYCVCGEH